MFPVHVVTRLNRHLYADALEQQFRLRHQIFVDELGWGALRRSDGREVDQFDTDHSIYLLGIEQGDRVVAGTRLGPTLEPHLLADVFPHAAAQRGVPLAPDIYDWTRIFVVPSRRGENRPCRAAGTIKAAVLEYCLAQGIRQVTGLGEPYWIPALTKLGWKPCPLGLPVEHEGMVLFGFTCEMTPQALRRTRETFGLLDPVTVSVASPDDRRRRRKAWLRCQPGRMAPATSHERLVAWARSR